MHEAGGDVGVREEAEGEGEGDGVEGVVGGGRGGHFVSGRFGWLYGMVIA